MSFKIPTPARRKAGFCIENTTIKNHDSKDQPFHSAIFGSQIALILAANCSAAQNPNSVWDGVYSAEQAAHGRETFIERCATCHGEGTLSLRRFDNQSVGDAFHAISRNMPPGTVLPQQEYADILAHLLELHDFPASEARLQPDGNRLSRIGRCGRLLGRFIPNKTGAAVLTEQNPFGYASDYRFWEPHRSQSLHKTTQPFTPEPVQRLAFSKAQTLDALPGGKADFQIFPNFFVVRLTHYVFTHIVIPLSHNRSRGLLRVYSVGKTQSASQQFSREYTTASLRDVHV